MKTLLILCLCLFITACFREDCWLKKKTPITVHPETKQYFNPFKEGSWWAYENLTNNTTDSIFVRDYLSYIDKCNPVESTTMTLKVKIFGQNDTPPLENIGTASYSIRQDTTSFNYSLYINNIQAQVDFVSGSIKFINQFYFYSFYLVNNKPLLPKTIALNNKTYANVLIIEDIDAFDIFGKKTATYDIYFAPYIGIILINRNKKPYYLLKDYYVKP